MRAAALLPLLLRAAGREGDGVVQSGSVRRHGGAPQPAGAAPPEVSVRGALLAPPRRAALSSSLFQDEALPEELSAGRAAPSRQRGVGSGPDDPRLLQPLPPAGDGESPPDAAVGP